MRVCQLTHPLSVIIDRLLQPLVEPLEVGALPQYTILRTQYPVVLIGEDEQLGRHSAQDGRIEGGHAL